MNSIANVSSFDYSALDRADLQPSTRTKYKRALERFIRADVPLDGLAEYAAGLSSSERSFLKAALSLVSAGRLNELKAGATPENAAAIQALSYRVEAMQGAIHVRATKGTKAHIWLSPKQVKQITTLAADNPLHWLVLGLMLGAGLRREELVGLTFKDVKQLPDEGGMRTVLEIRGKGDKSRVVPISQLLSDRLDAWRKQRGAKDSDRVIPVSAVRCFQIVRAYGKRIKMPELAPHDLRRTYAQLSHKGGLSIEETGYLLGHSSVTTTQRYLDLKLNTHITGSDFVPLSGD